MRIFILIAITTLCCCQQKQGTQMNRGTFYISDFDEIFSHKLWRKKSLSSLTNQKNQSALDEKGKFIYDAICDGAVASIKQTDSTFYSRIMSEIPSNVDVEVEKIFLLHYFESGEVYRECINIIVVGKEECFSYRYTLEGTESSFSEKKECNIKGSFSDVLNLIESIDGLVNLTDSSIVITELTKDDITCDVVISPSLEHLSKFFKDV